jgi:nitrogen fixation/metabolism regulation signal transduction histidine kinase
MQFNTGAEKILGQPLLPAKNRPIHSLAIFSDCAAQLQAGLLEKPEIQFQHESLRPDHQELTLLISGSRLPGTEPGFVVIFDDIGAVLSAQRSKAFADMARRLAHEIKNPLTPIQLSAERLQRRLSEKLGPDDADLLDRSTQTIVTQVTALKAMVDEFRNYARLPASSPELIDLDQLLSEMLLLYATDRRIRWQPTGQPHLIFADRSQVIQVVHNLVQNAQDAVGDLPNAEIALHVQFAGQDNAPTVRLTVADNGPGLSTEAKRRIFEPYFTSKTKGSGLGLAIVKKIAEENQAQVSLENRLDPVTGNVIGAVATIEFAKLSNANDNQTVIRKGTKA